MKISTLIVVMGVIGALTAAAVTLFQMTNVQESQSRSYNAINTQLYASAWTNKSEQSWLGYLDQYNPDGFSEDYEGIFTPDSEVTTEPGFIYNSIRSGAYEDARFALDDLFFFELEEQRLSFVMVYDLEGALIYCGYATDFPVGVDPCSGTAKADFQDDLTGFLTKTVRSKRQIVRVDDLQGVSTSTFNQTLIFPIKGEDRRPIAVAIMGRNVFANLELFEEEYAVRTAVSADDIDISLEEYGIGGSEGDYATPMADLISRSKELLTEGGSSQTASDNVLRHSMTALPISVYSSTGIGRLLIFTDQDAIYAELDDAQQTIFLLWAALIVAISGALAWITTLAFRGILKSIDVLNALTEQQQSGQRFEEVEMPTNSGVIAAVTSNESEVPQLISALSSYKEALLSNRQASRENRERRLQRDEIIAEKMRVLADQLEGEAKESMLQDVKQLQTVDETASEEEREAQSVELMSTAFSKMSDEVNNLIELKTADAIVARDEAMEAKEQTGRFFNNMSHELRTPLNAIIGYSEILYEDCEDEGYDDLMPDLKKITNSGKHLLELVNEILDIGKIQSGKMEFFAKSFDLGETLDMVRDITSPLADKAANKFVIDFPDDLSGTMYTDEGKLRQNLNNILSNAFKFTENGTITLSVSESVVEGINMVDFTISDTGRGMTQDFLETIFDEYSQQAGTSTASSEVQKSTGLGMAILAKYVEMAGGTVRVESELDVGTTFFMSMPRRYDDGGVESEDDELSKAIQNLKADSFVVMIDDDKNMHDVAKRTLGKAGINVIGAMDGESGLNVIRENKPSLILLDVYMPGREGWSILSEIKADPELKDIPVCMVTQLNEQDYAKSLGANGYFTKPIDREVFVTEVLKLLDTQEGSNQTILVIDDDANTRDLLKRILSEEGFDPQTAKDGLDGLETLDHLSSIGKNPSLIVLDISMPRMDGFQFLDAYADKVKAGEHVPVIIFSGKDMTLTQRDFLNNFENVIGIFAKGDLPNLASFIQRHHEDDGQESAGESKAS